MKTVNDVKGVITDTCQSLDDWNQTWCEGYVCASANILGFTTDEEDELMAWLKSMCEEWKEANEE